MPDDSHEDVTARLAAEPTPRMPDHVAARLHEALASEAQSREGSQSDDPTTSTVTPLRRGRWKAPLLAAAGIVAVVAIGVPVINQTSSDQSSDDGSSGGQFSSESTGRADGAAQGDQSAPQSEKKAPLAQLREDPMELHRSTFKPDVGRYLDMLEADNSLAPTQLPVSAVGCATGRPSAPGALPAELDGDDAVVITARQPSVGIQVKAVVCGADGPTVAARTTLD